MDEGKIQVVGNGVDLKKFHPVDRSQARSQLGLENRGPVLITVGGLVERKGFHRVIELLPRLLQEYPDLVYLIVGGPGPEGDWSERLRVQVEELGLQHVVRFLGQIEPEKLKIPLSAADLFVLSTANEGWANVFLEAMVCGLPVVTTDVGGNREVVCDEELGMVVPFGGNRVFEEALLQALGRQWNREHILSHARANSWGERVMVLKAAFREILDRRGGMK